jgi:uncharacterized membrane protein (DUF4010 family)
MEFQDLIARFAVALGIGLLVGLERGWRTREEAAGSRTAGIRTFALSGLLGGVAGALSQAFGGATSAGGGIFLGLALAVYAAVMALFCIEENRADKRFSATTAVVAMLTFALGAYALIGEIRAASALAVAAVVILALREQLHGWIASITWPELRSGLVLLAMTFVALPVLPHDPIGPFGGVNLSEVWLIAIVLAGVSFVGYAAVKYFGPSRGLLLAGAAGGLASSTAVTVTNARRAAAHEGEPRLLAAGVAIASAVMFARTIVVVGVINASLLPFVAPALGAAALAAAGFAGIAVYGHDSRSKQQNVKFRNPFSFWNVVGFAVFLGVIIVVSRLLGEAFGGAGAIIGAATIGLADVDAPTISMARLAPQTLSMHQAALAIVAAVATNTVSKIGIGAAIGRGAFALAIAGMALACFVLGGVALWLALRFAS